MSQVSTTQRTVLVTGGSRGIGRAICIEFGRAGWQVVVHYRVNRLAAEETVEVIRRAGGTAFFVQGDISHKQDCQSMVQAVMAQGGAIDVLVCNAGIASSRLIVRMEPTEWDAVMATNLTGTFYCLQAVAELFMTRGKGTIIVVGSFAGIQGQRGQASYAASKAGLIGLIKSAARELGPYHVSINGVLPGWQHTDMTESTILSSEVFEDQQPSHGPSLEEVASTVVHLSCLQGISGQIWNLDCRIY